MRARITENDKHFGPITYGRSESKSTSFVFSTGTDEGDDGVVGNHFWITLFGWVIVMYLPKMIAPHRKKITADSWDAATIERLGRNWYYNVTKREYGFRYSNGFFQLFYGVNDDDGEANNSKSWFLPWTEWTYVRTTWCNADGSAFAQINEDSNHRTDHDLHHRHNQDVNKLTIPVIEEDGACCDAIIYIKEREWHKGVGWFKWLRHVTKPIIRNEIEIEFTQEVGPRKGSWKGGLMGTSHSILPGETALECFKRYCKEKHVNRKGMQTLHVKSDIQHAL